VRELLEIAQSNCERLVLLINDILDVEKFSRGQMRFDVQTVPLAASSQAVEANEGYARKFQAHRRRHAADWRVAGRRTAFIQVMSNLLSNAASIRRRRHVRVGAKQRGGTCASTCATTAPASRGIPHRDVREVLAGRSLATREKAARMGCTSRAFRRHMQAGSASGLRGRTAVPVFGSSARSPCPPLPRPRIGLRETTNIAGPEGLPACPA
jgi:signal transduction histidine kinase